MKQVRFYKTTPNPSKITSEEVKKFMRENPEDFTYNRLLMNIDQGDDSFNMELVNITDLEGDNLDVKLFEKIILFFGDKSELITIKNSTIPVTDDIPISEIAVQHGLPKEIAIKIILEYLKRGVQLVDNYRPATVEQFDQSLYLPENINPAEAYHQNMQTASMQQQQAVGDWQKQSSSGYSSSHPPPLPSAPPQHHPPFPHDPYDYDGLHSGGHQSRYSQFGEQMQQHQMQDHQMQQFQQQYPGISQHVPPQHHSQQLRHPQPPVAAIRHQGHAFNYPEEFDPDFVPWYMGF